jgi:metal-responsive CopG/Arc/MetJ family transcriptional regulator
MGIRIDEDLLNLFDEKCKLETMTKTQIIVKAIKEYVNFNEQTTTQTTTPKVVAKPVVTIEENKKNDW